MKSAVIYARYSSDNQTEQSIEGQLRVCQDYAKRNNITIIDSYIDRAMTGTNDHRPAFQQMMKDSKNSKWDYVIVYKLDRFSRDKYESTIHKHTLKEHGVKLLSAMENIPDTPEGIILESLLEGMNQYYSAELSQKVKRGINESLLKGRFIGGNLLFGYKVVDHKIVVDEDNAKIVQEIFEKFSLGIPVHVISEELTARKITNNGKPLSRSSVYVMLHNTKYLGKYSLYGKDYDNLYPQIISQSLFDKVQKFKYKKNHITDYKTSYILKHKLICGYCKSPMYSYSGTQKNGIVRKYYKCRGRRFNNGCTKENIRKEVIEDIVLDSIISVLNKPKNLTLLTNHLLDTQAKMAKENDNIKFMEKDKAQTQTAINNIMKAIEKGVITETTTEKLIEYEQKLKDINESILLEQNKMKEKLSEEDIKKYFNKALKYQGELLVEYLVDTIVLYDDKIEIIFNNPIKNSPDDSQGFLFTEKIKSYKLKNKKYKFKIFIYI